MKHCKLIVLCISSIAIVICAVMIIRINVLYPNAEVISYSPSFVMVIEELCASNGAFPIINNDNPSQQSINVLPGEERQLVLKSMLSTSMLKYENFDKIESSTMTLVYSFYPYRRKLVFDKR